MTGEIATGLAHDDQFEQPVVLWQPARRQQPSQNGTDWRVQQVHAALAGERVLQAHVQVRVEKGEWRTGRS
jgi:hypothetical protein